LHLSHKVQELKIRREFRKNLQHTLTPENLDGYSKQERQFRESATEATARQYWDYIGLAWQLRDEGKWDNAEEMFKKAIKINPENCSAYQDLGMFYTSQRKYEEAKEMFKKAIEISPTYDWAYIELGSCYELLGQREKSEEMFKKAIEINPEGDKAYGGLARCYERQGKYMLAEECFSQLNKMRLEKYNPVTKRNYYKLIEIVTRMGIRLVCVQYPVRSIKPLEKMLEPYKKDIIFVDNEKLFKEALRLGSYDEYFEDSFAGDFGHCTKKGNELLADNIAKTISKSYFKR
jgi:tetratricopeptide (TPR) repeat protein